MEEQDLDIVEFEETFTKAWLERHMRSHGMYGGIVKHLIPLKSGGYILPRQLERHVEGYLVHRYLEETGGVQPVNAQEIYTVNHDTVSVLCQAMFVPVSTPTTQALVNVN